jgi:hypothetical protein
MRKYARAGVVLSLALLGAGCDGFIQGPGLTENPNAPISGTARQQMISMQAAMHTLLEGQLARTAAIYTQQVVGQNNQQLSVTQYQYGESDYSGFFNGFYVGGGLVALRNIQALATANSDQLLLGIASVWEGLAIGTATSIWGDIPYSEAVSAVLTPKLDPQQEVYAAVQAKLDAGIAALNAAGAAGAAETSDLVYCATAGCARGTQISRWIAAANTLKARFHLDMAERNGNAAYTLALNAANNGIMEAPTTPAQAMHGQAPGDFRTFHGGVQDVDANVWAGFLAQRGGDIRAGHTLVQLLKDRNDPRLEAYFAPNSTGGFFGLDRNANPVGGTASELSAVRRTFTFRQPLVTWAENQLILAEAKFVLQGAAAALPHVNNVRRAVGMTDLGAVTLQDVMREKYIAMFQNIATWSDYRRTCVPVITPFGTSAEVPGRIPYGSFERTNNPNIPLPSAFPTGTTGASPLRNWNDPQACPRP